MKMTSFFKMSVLAAGMVAAMGANAGDTGVLNVTGTVIASSCVVDPSSTTDVPMGTLSAADFTAVGSISPKQDITLNLTGCPLSQTGVMFAANGAADATNNQLLALSADSIASGLGIALYNKGGDLIPMHSASAAAPIDAEAGTATINLEAAAMSTADAVTGGAFNATTTFTLSYN
ncbi:MULTISPECIES: fimbrial protein [Rahnella]|uniref:fimbrial protein n=1 Tax=Rahnella TaxID=34037 RepID=UPI001060F34F|nr:MULTISPECIES: fimbrial protein [Rahnella]TDS92768.1 major type 1 subunit fimbrin (pilin) [Rahnella sp. BIGb0236]UHM91704.1 type 1 fimbrial protein [Rahnella victoriana]VTQ67499.1 fimbrial protein BcfF [Campylobacter jejuni]